MKKNQVDIITMGCSKNLVDSESLTRLLVKRGFHCVYDPKRPQGEYVVVNTCGFIDDAKQESIDMILELIEMKKAGQIGKLFVMGCLSQRYLNQLEDEIPEVDKYYGKFNFRQLAEDLTPPETPPQPSPQGEGAVKDSSIANKGILNSPSPRGEGWGGVLSGVRSTPRHYAYLKISEGCDRHCAYCAIPIITGKHQSRPKAEILEEVREMVAEGVKEINVIAQELTYYGVDLDGKRHIADLIEEMADIPGVEWIRLHYAYPNQFPMELLRVIREKKNVCNYLDIALQHISDHMLDAMHRNTSKQETLDLIKKIREEVPGIYLRTTLMVGFPGETDEDFKELMEFVREARFERMGAFTYSEEEGTYSATHYEDDVPQQVKQRRLDKLMALQQEISAELEAEKIGSVQRVVIDRKEGDYYIGRTEFSSPEVDPEVLIPATKRLYTGRFYNVKITNSEEFDLYGEVI